MFAKECDSKRIDAVQVYQAKLAVSSGSQQSHHHRRRSIRLYNILFLILYALQTGWVVSTIGEPYRTFLEKADREGFQGACMCVSMPETIHVKRSELQHGIVLFAERSD